MVNLLQAIRSCRHAVMRRLRGYVVLRQVASHMGEVYVGGPTRLSNGTALKRNPNFNGMTVNGCGEVVFGNNFLQAQIA